MTCSVLSGNPCGDQELTLAFKSTDPDQEPARDVVCHPRSFLQRNMTEHREESIDLGFWYSNHSLPFEVSCFLWFTEDGRLPLAHTDTGSVEIPSVNVRKEM